MYHYTVKGSLDAQDDFDNLIIYFLIVVYVFLPINPHSNIFTYVYIHRSTLCPCSYAGLFPTYLLTCEFAIGAMGS